MTDLQITRHDDESFRDFHARAATEHALHEQSLRTAQREALATILRVESFDLLAVIDLNPDETNVDADRSTYVVEINCRFAKTVEKMWTTIVSGCTDHTLFYDRPRAVLHALAADAGVDINAARHLVDAAARVLTLDADGE